MKEADSGVTMRILHVSESVCVLVCIHTWSPVWAVVLEHRARIVQGIDAFR
jgi:hypothetical protein